MKVRGTALLAAATLLSACSPARYWPRMPSSLPPDQALEVRVDSILAGMTVEEKVGQVIQPDIRRVTPEDVRRYHIGSVLNGGGGFPEDNKYATVHDWLRLADGVWQASVDRSGGRAGIPIIWGVDAVHGHNNVIGATLFPHNVGLGAANDPELVRRIGEITAREVRVTGHDWNFSPTVAVARDGRWGRAYESYSEDPEIVAAYADAIIRGLQGEPGTPGFLDDHRVIATAKHFLADGGTTRGVDQGDARMSARELHAVHGAGYLAALRAGVQAIMPSFSSWNGMKMHQNRNLLTGVLKERLAFDGVLVGDWNAHGQIPGCSNSSCPEAIRAGLDIFMVPDDWKQLYENTLAQVRTGEIAAERLDDAVRRILRVKARAGVLDRGLPSRRMYAADTAVLGAPAHRAVAREAVRKSLVLLKNNGRVLPLRPGSRILVAGDGAHDIGKQAGGWTLTWQGTGNRNEDFPGASSIWDGIESAVRAGGGTVVLSADGSYAPAEKPDAAIVVFGENPYAEFQGDRESVHYPRGEELSILQSLRRDGIPTVSVFLTGRPLWVNRELNASDAFVVAWLPGSEGVGVADVLIARPDGLPRYDFQGRLSFSWPARPDQAVLNRGDAVYDPLFPYGYGLSYREHAAVPVLPEAASPVAEADGRITYFRGGPVAPWRLWLRGGLGEVVPASTRKVESRGGEVSVTAVDRRMQEDARLIEWSGAGTGRIWLGAVEGVDISRENNAGYALAFDVRMDRPAGGAIHFRITDSRGTEQHVDLKPILNTLPAGEWRTIRLRLRCFADMGFDWKHLTMPWSLETGDPAALTISDIRLVPEEDGPAQCR